MLADYNASRDLPLFIGTDQPETCRKCAARTDFDEVEAGLQVHQCSRCANRYAVEFE
jgi:hypothetical protein